MNIDIEYCKDIENIVIIPSYIGTTLTVLSKEDRYEQTKLTFKTVREKIPKCFIAFIDITEFTEEQYNYIKDNCDLFLNETSNEELKAKVLHAKSYGEMSYIIYLLNVLNNHEPEYNFSLFPKLRSVFKVGARYYLNENFDYNKFNVDKDVFGIIEKDTWALTGVFKICKHNVWRLIYNFNTSYHIYYLYTQGGSIEHVMYWYYKHIIKPEDRINLDIIGYSGLFATGEKVFY